MERNSENLSRNCWRRNDGPIGTKEVQDGLPLARQCPDLTNEVSRSAIGNVSCSEMIDIERRPYCASIDSTTSYYESANGPPETR